MRAEGDSSSNGTSRPFSNGSGPSPLHKAAVSNSANGMRKSPVAMNGSSNTNGHTGKQRQPYFGHDREEVTRILIQALTDLGYDAAASSLSQESGFDLESPSVAAFRHAVIRGEWTQAEELLFGRQAEAGAASTGGNGLILQENVDKNAMRFALRQQKFLELLEQRDTRRALIVLRTELTPIYHDVTRHTQLSSLLMCQSTEDLKSKAHWDGAQGVSRHMLLSELSQCISPSVMLPERRLAILLDQVKKNQISSCLYHNTAASPSLYQDHRCDATNFPMQPIVDLSKHNGQVWQVKFSDDGSRLASCGEDGAVVIYDVASFEVLHVLASHEQGVGSVAWSPDGKLLVTCCQDRRARLWDVETGDLKCIIPRFGEPASNCAWSPDSQSFVVGSLANERNLVQYDLHGDVIFDWRRKHRVQDVAISHDGRWLVAMDHETKIYAYNFITREAVFEMNMKARLRSIAIARDSRSLLVNMQDGETQILDLQREADGPVQRFKAGDQGGNDVIRATFGGANESFVVTGSADGKVYIFHRENGQLIKELDGHQGGCCSAVSWNPSNPCMFASCGDDHKVRIWSNEDTTLSSSKNEPASSSNGWVGNSNA